MILGRRFEVNSAILVVESAHADEYPRGVHLHKPYPLKYVNHNNQVKEMPVTLYGGVYSKESLNAFGDYLNDKYGIYQVRRLHNADVIVYNADDQYRAVLNEMRENVCMCDFDFRLKAT